jgi:endoglucanase
MKASSKPIILLLTVIVGLFSSGLFAQTIKEAGGGWRVEPSPLSFQVSKAGGSQMNAIAMPVRAMRGHKLAISISAKGTGVSPRPQSWNGIKVMIKIESPGETSWPQLSMPEGSFDWRAFNGIIGIPESATALTLILGLEQVSGKVEMRDLAISLRPQLPLPSPPPADAPVFTGHGGMGLRGAMVSPKDITASDLDTLVSGWGANLVRWQLSRPTGSGSDPASYDRWLDSMLEKLDQGLVQAEKIGCRVVVDLHSPPGGGDSPGGYVDAGAAFFASSPSQAHFIDTWKKIALRYRGNEAIWGFDLLNEPVDADTAADCRDWNMLALDAGLAIREIDPDRSLIVECAEFGSPYGFASFRPLPLDRVVYSFHMYQPFEFTHQGVQGQTAAYAYPGKIGSSMWDRAALKQAIAPAADFARKWRVQMYVGEFGAARWAKGADAYLADLISIFEEYGWDWTFHAYREWQGWSPEYDEDPRSTLPSSKGTERLKVLKKAFALNG